MASLKDFSLYDISWNLSPEHAVTMYLECGNNDCAEDLISVPLPEALLPDYQAAHGSWRGISEPTPAIKDWLRQELGHH